MWPLEVAKFCVRSQIYVTLVIAQAQHVKQVDLLIDKRVALLNFKAERSELIRMTIFNHGRRTRDRNIEETKNWLN